MKARERIIKTLNHEEPDRIPSFEISIDNLSVCKHFGVEYPFQGVVKSFLDTYNLCKGNIKQFTDTILAATETRTYIKNTSKKHMDLFDKVGIDLATIPVTGYVLFPTICEKNFLIDEFGRIFDLKKNLADEMDMIYYRDGYFKTIEEYAQFPPLQAKSKRRERYLKAIIGSEKEYNGNVCVIPSMWGVFEPVWQAFGFTNFCKLLSKPNDLKKLFDNRGQFAVDLVKYMIELGEKNFIFIFDDYGYKSGLLMSPKLYRMYVIPWIKEICSVAHKSGVKIILHSCGDVYQLVEDLIYAGIDALHPIEPTTANPEYDIFKLHNKYGDKISFIGNISPQDLADKSTNEIKEQTKRLIKELAPGGGYLLSSGHSINPAIKLENFLAMHETLKKYRKYPIKI